MPKRKHSRSRDEDINHMKKKIKKLERKILKRQNVDTESESGPEDSISHHRNTITDTPPYIPDDWLLEMSEGNHNATEPLLGPSTSLITPIEENPSQDANVTELDSEILDILGNDPSESDTHGPEIRNELARRLLHIAKEGLNKEDRKVLISKYPVPANCTQIDAPKMNPEIKAAIDDTAIKRDKGIEIKQKQLTSAIACLSNVINIELNAKTKNNEILQKLMDVGRILCDIQHMDSITRRNFTLFALKNNMKEHLKNTKIDSFLFGENLAETLKSAKAVNRSGIDLKADSLKTTNSKQKGTSSRSLNRRAPPQARRLPAGTAAPMPRSHQSAAVHVRFPPPQRHQPPHAHSSTALPQTHQAMPPRRRY